MSDLETRVRARLDRDVERAREEQIAAELAYQRARETHDLAVATEALAWGRIERAGERRSLVDSWERASDRLSQAQDELLKAARLRRRSRTKLGALLLADTFRARLREAEDRAGVTA